MLKPPTSKPFNLFRYLMSTCRVVIFNHSAVTVNTVMVAPGLHQSFNNIVWELRPAVILKVEFCFVVWQFRVPVVIFYMMLKHESVVYFADNALHELFTLDFKFTVRMESEKDCGILTHHNSPEVLHQCGGETPPPSILPHFIRLKSSKRFHQRSKMCFWAAVKWGQQRLAMERHSNFQQPDRLYQGEPAWEHVCVMDLQCFSADTSADLQKLNNTLLSL